MEKLTDQEKKEISICLKKFVDFFYIREMELFKKLAGTQTDPDIDIQTQLIVRAAFLANAFPLIRPMLDRLGISDADFIRYMQEYQIGIRNRDSWYYKQEFESLEPPE